MILLQGLPGIGKTTLIKNLSYKLQSSGIEVEGFYTEEVRNNNNKGPRIGFDVVTIKDNIRKSLARKSAASDFKGPTVGQYSVHLNNFESLVLPLFSNTVKDKKGVFIIDEIGKMELFSKDFQKLVNEIMDNKNKITVATVPLKNGPPFVQRIKQADNVKLITVTNANRDQLLDELFNLIKEQI